MNKINLIGRLTKDPELRFTPGNGTAVATFTLAVDRKFKSEGQPEADFIPIVVWGKQAENTANYMSKGKLIGVSGRIQTRNYEAKDGTRRYVTEVVAEEIKFLEWGDKNQNKGSQQQGKSKPSQGQRQNQYQKQYEKKASGGSDLPDFTEVPDFNNSNFGGDFAPVDDEDIPF